MQGRQPNIVHGIHWSETVRAVRRDFAVGLIVGSQLLAVGLGTAAYADIEPAPAGEEAIIFQEIPSVYGASKFEQKVTEAPSFVTLVTSNDIKVHGYRTVAEVLQSVPGFFVTYDRNYNYLGVRGFNRPGDFNTRVLLLVDGHRLNDNLYDQAGLGTESLVDVDLIDRIEVIRGPSSSLYGTNAFFGVINVVTKRGRDLRGLEISSELGSWSSRKVRGTYGDKFSNGAELILSGSYFDSEGRGRLYFREFDDPQTGNGVTRDADDDKYPSFFGKLSFREFTLQGGFVSREKGIPTASYGTFFPTTETRSTDEHGYLSLKYETEISQETDFEGRIYYDRFYYQGDYLYDVSGTATPDLVLNQDRSTGEWWGTELMVESRAFDRHNVTAGLEFRDNFRQDLWNADTDPEIVYLDEKGSHRSWALFTQDQFQISENLILNAGVRYDQYESFGGTVSPRVALIRHFDQTTVKALYGEAFRAPNAYERFYVGTGFKANPDLDPENIATYELVVEHALAKHLRATATVYFYRIDDLISQEADPSDGLLVFQNRGNTEAKGLELQLEFGGPEIYGVSGRFSYAIQEAMDRRTGKGLTNSPTHLANLTASVPIIEDRLTAGLEIAYVSERTTLARDTTGGYSTTNLTLLSTNLLKGLELSANVRNLFGEVFWDPGSGEHVQDRIRQDGRSYWLKIKYAF